MLFGRRETLAVSKKPARVGADAPDVGGSTFTKG